MTVLKPFAMIIIFFICIAIILRQQLYTSTRNNAELLMDVKASHIKDHASGIGLMNKYSLRGATAKQTLVMLDEQRINNPQKREVDLSLIPLERVEIVLSGASIYLHCDVLKNRYNLQATGRF